MGPPVNLPVPGPVAHIVSGPNGSNALNSTAFQKTGYALSAEYMWVGAALAAIGLVGTGYIFARDTRRVERMLWDSKE